MAENKQIPPQFDLNAKWDACLDLTLRRFFYSSLAGAFGGLLFFRSPVTRWASIAFGAGVGLGSAYNECSLKYENSPPKLVAPKISVATASQHEQD
ncbi:PREDICTED: MICOS complex subunit Mic10 [Nelumbo nucifera]|uniref:MICOS complex subunit Mic10 n=1 Tax=Nelumbo nucifera TaxID=4432 RepID=A0A1U7Z3T3_NELNU|nr:PREDICTED: MICOS complex subunit Mic10 [Nelumbo nucifera]